jgi:hexokinase
MTQKKENAGSYDTSTGEMIINTEWGSFDNALKTLPVTPYDISLDKDTPNPGIQMFEKLISGMYLGEIFRRAVLSLIQDEVVPLFSDEHSATNDMHTTTCINSDSPFYKNWGVDSSFLSQASGDSSDGLRITRLAIQKDLGVDAPSTEDAQAVKLIASAVGKRAARLAAVAVGAIVIRSGRLGQCKTDDDTIDVGVDGSLVEFYPGFEDYIREA